MREPSSVVGREDLDTMPPAPKRRRGDAPASISRARGFGGELLDDWRWTCRPCFNASRMDDQSAGSQATALTALARHQRERHPGPALVALAAAHLRRLEVAHRALHDAGLAPVVAAAGIDALEATRLLAQDPAALAAVREVAREAKGGEPG